jgi:hypothetical protein
MFTYSFCSNNSKVFFLQNRRAKWRKREPPRKTGYISSNSPSTQLSGPPPFSSFPPQTTTVTPPGGSVDSWTSYQSPYELSPHFNILSPAASPYGSFSASQYGTYVHESSLFPTRQHYEYGSPNRIDGEDGGHHKSTVLTSVSGEHYATMDDKYDGHCSER